MKRKTGAPADRERFLELLKETEREGIDYVIEELEALGFFDAPASSSHHLNQPGGLVRHSLNVYDEAMTIREHLLAVRPEMKKSLDQDSIAIACLLHDVCKAEIYKRSVRSRKTIDGSWEKFEAYEIQRDAFPCGHGEKSVIQLLRWGLYLTDDEILAIRWHMGPWDLAFQSMEQTGSLSKAKEASPLLCLVEQADGIATNLIESKLH